MPFAPYTGYVPFSQTLLSCSVEEPHPKHSDKRILGLLLRATLCAIPLIKDCAVYRSAIIEMEYTYKTKGNTHIGDFIEQTSKRNKDSAIQNVLSVSNSQGFIQQCEQFENRSVASDDISNYKIVERNCFAFNPARINVGSIARLTTFDRGIVSPMYICFRTKDNLFPEYLDYYFESKYNPQIEMFARFKMKSSFHKTKRII